MKMAQIFVRLPRQIFARGVRNLRTWEISKIITGMVPKPPPKDPPVRIFLDTQKSSSQELVDCYKDAFVPKLNYPKHYQKLPRGYHNRITEITNQAMEGKNTWFVRLKDN